MPALSKKSTYQSVSGAGKEGMDELWDQTKSIYNPVTDVPPTKFTKQIAFNVIPHIDKFLDDGSTKEEWKMVAETKKIIGYIYQSDSDLCEGSSVCWPF